MEGLLFFRVYPSDGFRFILIPDGNPSHEFPVLDGNPSSNMNSAIYSFDATKTFNENFAKKVRTCMPFAVPGNVKLKLPIISCNVLGELNFKKSKQIDGRKARKKTDLSKMARKGKF